jgi:hypothetical protein
VLLEGFGQLKNPMTSSGIEPVTFRFVGVVPQPSTLLRAPSADRCSHIKIEGYMIGIPTYSEGPRFDFRCGGWLS